MTDIQQLEISSPSFLSLLDDHPSLAFEQFYRFAERAFEHCPPSSARNLDWQSRKDLLHDIVYHCVRDDFRVLRLYKDQSRSFAGWLYIVAHRVAVDFQRRTQARLVVGNESKAVPIGDELEYRRLIEHVKTQLATLGERCRVLLILAADEYQPREIVRLLSLPADDNKRVADQIRECRRQLVMRLERQGIILKEWL